MNYIHGAMRRIRPAPFAVFLRKVFGINRRAVKSGQGRFFIDPGFRFRSRIIKGGEYEPYMEKTLEAYLNPGDVFLDVGANEGYFSVLGSKLVGLQGRVLAVEPQTSLIPVIEENLRLNQIRM